MNTEDINNNLLQLQESLTTRINAIKRDFSEGRSADFSEQATEQENEEVLVQLKADAEAELRQVNIALKKVETDLYGVCEKCSEDIAEERLKVIPYTQYCINCA